MLEYVMKNFTLSFVNVDELEALMDSSSIDSSSTLIQIFCAQADEEKIVEIQEFFQKNYPESTLIGATTDGAIDGLNFYVATKSVATFTCFESTVLNSSLIKNEACAHNSFRVGQALAYALLADDLKVIISFTDGTQTNGEEYANGVSSVAPNATLSGGMAADNGQMRKTYVFTKYDFTSSGAVGVSLCNAHLNVSTKYAFDWTPIGKKLTITKAIKNRVYEIDGLSPVAVYAKYFGQELANQLPQVGVEFPLVFQKNGVLIGRSALLRHNDGSLTFAGNVPEGTEVSFGLGNIEKILHNSHYHVGNMIDDMEYETEAVFIYSCMARRQFMKDYVADELRILNILGSVSGFFTYGEFFHAQSGNQLLNETMTLLALSETKKPMLKSMKKIPENPSNYTARAEHAISNLANQVSSELAELNDNLERRIKDSSDYIYKQAYFDKLTGLPNRLSLIRRLEESMGKMIFLINIDDFTSINDFYGHEIGDKALKHLSQNLNDVSKESNFELFKLPSDEFAIIADMSHDKDVIGEKIVECVQRMEKNELSINGNLIHITITVAAASINKNKTGLVNADMALKLAKKSGKEYLIFDEDPALSQRYEENIKMANVIRQAISEDKFIPYFQPLLNLKTGAIDKYEALVRLKREDGEILSPYAFLEISKKIKLYAQITEIMIEKTFAYFQHSEYSFSLNLSFSDILNEKTRKFLFLKIDEYGVAPRLTIEILETQEHDNEAAILSFTKEVYACGANIAIDDFGSGYANFQHMTTIKSDFMKIDGSLIKNMDKDDNARLIVETIIVFAQKLRKKTVAEFVHSKEIYEIVKELGIDYAQGYYIGMPLEQTL